MTGKWKDDTSNGTCSITATGMPTKTCEFKEDDHPGVKASLMFHHDAEGVTIFNVLHYYA